MIPWIQRDLAGHEKTEMMSFLSLPGIRSLTLIHTRTNCNKIKIG